MREFSKPETSDECDALLSSLTIGSRVQLRDGRIGEVGIVSIEHGRCWLHMGDNQPDVPAWPSQLAREVS